jgi:hypothetical protein
MLWSLPDPLGGHDFGMVTVDNGVMFAASAGNAPNPYIGYPGAPGGFFALDAGNSATSLDASGTSLSIKFPRAPFGARRARSRCTRRTWRRGSPRPAQGSAKKSRTRRLNVAACSSWVQWPQWPKT